MVWGVKEGDVEVNVSIRSIIKKVMFTLFIAYAAVVIYATLIRENEHVYGKAMNLDLFSTIRLMWESGNIMLTLTNILGNIVMFAPLGMFIPLFMKWFDGFIQVFTTGFLISFLIEILQYKLTERVFDIDDIFLNTLGTFIGWVIIKILYWIKNMLKAHFKKR
jgi:glycopeptide antibiotics resistance protein